MINRRAAMRHALTFAAGAVGATTVAGLAGSWQKGRPLPFYSGPAASIHADRRTPPKHSGVKVVWSAGTARPVVALTFDDGPMPLWTPKVLEVLRRMAVPATFFLVGENVVKHADLIAGHLDRHEFGNHTWEHHDLARLDLGEAMEAIGSAHAAIERVTGRAPVLLRPPYGHLGGSTLLAAAEFGYTVVLWSRQMLESEFVTNPAGLVDYIAGSVAAGDIVLAHDTGPQDRLVAIDNLEPMIEKLITRGFEFVTVSQLLGISPG
jgi:peptidoglycan/xylan/chitin deacetylase (PgdA/CDA1 family)